MKRRHFFGLIGAVIAVPWTGDALPAPAAPIAAFDDALISIMKAGKATPFQRRFDMLAPVLQQSFDLDQILKSCIGPRYASLTADEQSALSEVFRRFTIASWVANFNSFSGQSFEISPELRAVGEEQVVSTTLKGAGDPVRLDYVMHQTSGSWRVVDILLDGTISRVAVQRSDFRTLLASGVDALIASLKRKASDLSGQPSPS
jgi:phospholipid transport system substrate-binding protein